MLYASQKSWSMKCLTRYYSSFSFSPRWFSLFFRVLDEITLTQSSVPESRSSLHCTENFASVRGKRCKQENILAFLVRVVMIFPNGILFAPKHLFCHLCWLKILIFVGSECSLEQASSNAGQRFARPCSPTLFPAHIF